ncbi:MAG: hypothetical protein IKN49_01645 [Elusimicrobiaceae bacterium]|nr:hypothetical protein [Elusimicrobiaceae bacterium]
MADEKQEQTEITELEEKLPAQRSSKDLWLFLIIVDVVLLCVFGFFLYKNLSAMLLSPQDPMGEPKVVEETLLVEEDAAGDVVEIAQATVVETVPPAQPKISEPEPVKEEPVKSEPATVEPAPVAKPAAKPTEPKESVSVKVNPKSKYRQVTFRYFGEAKDVAVVSGFTMAKPRALSKKNGVWETTLSIAPGTYKYLLVIDGQQQPDPYAEEKDGRSVLVVK